MKIRYSIFLIVVSVSILSVQYHSISRATFENKEYVEREVNFLSLQSGLEEYKKVQNRYWLSRIVTCYMASIWSRVIGVEYSNAKIARINYTKNNSRDNYNAYLYELKKLSFAIATHQTIILGALFLVVIALSKRKLLFILGIGSALCYAWTPAAHGHVCPWDSWAITVWTIILLVNDTKHKKHIIWMIPAFSLLKETTIILSVLMLFWGDVPIKIRIKYFCISFLSVLVIKFMLGIITGTGGSPSYTLHYPHPCKTGEYWIIERNTHALTWWSNFNPIYFSISGLLAGIFLLPIEKQYKLISLTYLLFIFVPCVITEARLFQELVPVVMVGISKLKVSNL
jgi:hypothetical protein